MPVSLRISPDGTLAIATATGVLRLEDAQEGAEALWKTGWVGEATVWDLHGAQFDMSPADARTLARFILDHQPQPPPKRVAFVTPRDADFGMVRMFEVFRAHPATETRVFRDQEEGVAWAKSAGG